MSTHNFDELVSKHLHLVPKIVRSIPAVRYVGGGTEIDDLVQEGSIALMEAAKRYQPGDATFATYATKFITLAVKRAIERQGKTIYVPTHIQEAYRRLKHREGVYLSQEGKKPTDADLGALLGMDSEGVRKLREVFEAAPLDSFQVDELPDE